MTAREPRWVIRGYFRGYLLSTSEHSTDASKDAAVDAWRKRIERREATRIEIEDRHAPQDDAPHV